MTWMIGMTKMSRIAGMTGMSWTKRMMTRITRVRIMWMTEMNMMTGISRTTGMTRLTGRTGMTRVTDRLLSFITEIIIIEHGDWVIWDDLVDETE